LELTGSAKLIFSKILSDQLLIKKAARGGPQPKTNNYEIKQKLLPILADILGIRNLPLKFHDKCKA